MHNVPSKSQLIFNGLHDIISRNIELFITTAPLQIEKLSNECAAAGKPRSSESGTGGIGRDCWHLASNF
jgi:hypothetical protein